MMRKTLWDEWWNITSRPVDGAKTQVIKDEADRDVAEIVHRVGVVKVEIYREDGKVIAYTRAPEFNEP